MIKPIGEAALVAAIARVGITPGRAAVDAALQFARQHPGRDVRVSAADMAAIDNEIGLLTEAAGRLGDEVRAARDNVRFHAEKPIEGERQACLNCRFFEAVRSLEAHVVVEHQHIAQDAGACLVDPPMPLLLPGKPPVASFFRPVHPERWCGRWEKLDNRMVPRT